MSTEVRPRRLPSLVLPLCALALLVGCNKPKVTSQLNPFASSEAYEHVLVYFSVAEVEFREIVESEVAKEEGSGRFEPSYLVFVPGREYSPDQVEEILRRNGIDAVLMLSFAEFGSSDDFRARFNPGACTIWSRSEECPQRPSYYNRSKPFASLYSALYEMETSTNVWGATAKGSGSGGVLLTVRVEEGLLRSLARETVKQMKKDGVIR